LKKIITTLIFFLFTFYSTLIFADTNKFYIGGGGSFGGTGVSQGTSITGGGQGLQFDRSLNLVGEFRVKGQDLVYVFNEASSRNQRG